MQSNRHLENMTMKSTALAGTGQLNIAFATKLFVQTAASQAMHHHPAMGESAIG